MLIEVPAAGGRSVVANPPPPLMLDFLISNPVNADAHIVYTAQ